MGHQDKLLVEAPVGTRRSVQADLSIDVVPQRLGQFPYLEPLAFIVEPIYLVLLP